MNKKFYDDVLNGFVNAEDHKWFVNICNTPASCWLGMAPRTEAFTLTNMEFEMMLAHRMRQYQLSIPVGLACNCNDHPLLDRYGHHCMHGCKTGGHYQRIHDNVKYALKGILNFNGIPTKIEELNCFIESEPNGRKRPDISIPVTDKLCDKKTVLDVTITATLTGVTGNQHMQIAQLPAVTQRGQQEETGTAATGAAGAVGRVGEAAAAAAVAATTRAAGAVGRVGEEAAAVAAAIRAAGAVGRVGEEAAAVAAEARAASAIRAVTGAVIGAQVAVPVSAATAVQAVNTTGATGATGLLRAQSPQRTRSGVKPGSQAAAARQRKVKKYGTIALQNNLGFIPFAIETSGYMDKDAREFLRKVCEYGATEKKIKYTILINWAYKQLITTLHRALIEALKTKVRQIVAKNTRPDSYRTYENVLNNDAIFLN